MQSCFAAQVEWNMTPQEFSLAGLWQNLPIYAFFAFAFSFLGVCLAIGIFKCADSPCSLVLVWTCISNNFESIVELFNDIDFGCIRSFTRSLCCATIRAVFLRARAAV